jgi:hypothetical protein
VLDTMHNRATLIQDHAPRLHHDPRPNMATANMVPIPTLLNFMPRKRKPLNFETPTHFEPGKSFPSLINDNPVDLEFVNDDNYVKFKQEQARLNNPLPPAQLPLLRAMQAKAKKSNNANKLRNEIRKLNREQQERKDKFENFEI